MKDTIERIFAERGVPENEYEIREESSMLHLNGSQFRYGAFSLESKEDKMDFAERAANHYHQIPNDDWKVVYPAGGTLDYPDMSVGLGYVRRPTGTIAEILTESKYRVAYTSSVSNNRMVHYAVISMKNVSSMGKYTMADMKRIKCMADAFLPMNNPGVRSLVQPKPGRYYEGNLIWVYPYDNLVFFLLPVGGWTYMNMTEFKKSFPYWPQEIQEEFTMWENMQGEERINWAH